MRNLGLVRQNGWIGGVCGSIAVRLGIDPIIVRGIAVVVAILGGPAFLFYAAGWLLLPDADDRIHLERLIRGHFEPAVVGVAVLALLTFLPFTQGIWWTGAQFWGEPHWGESLFRVLWSFAVIALIVAFLIWAARRASWSPRGGGTAYSSRMASASAATAPGNPPETPTAPQTPPAPEPPPAPGGADFEAWKKSQAGWKEQHAAWTRQQRDDQRTIRQQRSAELREQSQILAAERAEHRRAKRLTNPRTSAAYVFAVIGLALVTGAAAAGISSTSGVWRAYEVTCGFAIATLAFGVGIIAAGLTRRRSGFLSFMSILLVLFTVSSALIPRNAELLFPAANIMTGASARYVQPVGAVYLVPDAQAIATGPSGPQIIDLQQGIGATVIQIDGDRTVRVVTDQQYERNVTAVIYSANGEDATTKALDSTQYSAGSYHSAVTIGTAEVPEVIVRVHQFRGAVYVYNDLHKPIGLSSSNTFGGK